MYLFVLKIMSNRLKITCLIIFFGCLKTFATDEEFQKALSLQNNAKYEEALNIYKKLSNQDISNAVIWNNIGLCQQKLKKFEQAEKSYQKALKYAPTDAQAYNNFASLKLTQNDSIEAEQLYLKAISKDPEYPFSYNNLASLYKNQGKLFKAIEKYKQAIDRAPIAEFYYNLGLLYFGMKKYDDMLETFNKALDLQPNYAEVYYSLALAHYYNLLGYSPQKRKIEFRKSLSKLIDLNPQLAQKLKETCNMKSI
jgi:tetratricopeptide (TPR) repeat protein